jgi:HK97 family phage prohead protease
MIPHREDSAQTEYRMIGAELRVAKGPDGAGHTLEGYAARYNVDSVDMGGWVERIVPGAFDRTLRENPDVLALMGHDRMVVLGRTLSGTLKLETDSRGLAFRCALPDTTQAHDLAVSIDRGDIRGCSFGFANRKASWAEPSKENPLAVRELQDIDLFEISITPFPAYPQTSVALRSMPRGMRSHVRSVDGGCTCPCPQCLAGACNLCSFPDCEWPGCTCPEQNSTKSPRTKKVDGEDLTADCFLVVGDPTKTATWKLPWKFSTEEKTQSHLRDALARFDQLEDVAEEEKAKVWKRLVELCKEHGIDVSDEDARSGQACLELRLRLATLRARTGNSLN